MRVRIQFFLPALLFCLAALTARAQSNLLITEFVASNNKSLNDEDGESSDWIEIYNAGTNAVSLEGWYLTDTTNNLTKWRFPNVTLLENSYLVVFASEKNRTNLLAKLHTNFKLSTDGEYLALVRPDGTNVASQFAPQYPAQQTDISYGRDLFSTEILGYFVTPTPGQPNSTSGPGFAGAVQFSRAGGTFPQAFSLVLSNTAPSSNAVIRYTLNGAPPTNSSPAFTNPIAISTTTQVRARVFETGLLPGSITTEFYLALNTNVLRFSSDLPIVVFHNFGRGAVPADPLQFVALEIFEPKAGRSSLTNVPDVSTRAGFKLRGSSTQGIPKGSFALETWDEFNDDKDISLLGLPADSDWVFYAPNHFEPVLIHNPFMFELSNQIGHWASRTRFVEVFLNTAGGTVASNNYNGLYVLIERIKRGKDRVDVDELGPEDLSPPEITGGYILKQDRTDPGDTGFRLPTLPNVPQPDQPLLYVDPKEPEIETPQRDPQEFYIKNYLTNFVLTLSGTNFANATNGYSQFIEVDSWIDDHILNVLAFNVDAYRLSGYFYKPRGGKLRMGPIWDFDRTLGSTDGRDSNPRFWRSPSGDQGTDFFNYPWWGRLFKDPDFFQKWIDRWQELRTGPFTTNNLFGLIDSMANQLREAQVREVIKWPSETRPRSGLYTGNAGYQFNFGTSGYQGEVNFMKQWLKDRIQFIDTNFLAAPLFSQNGGPIAAGFNLGIIGLANLTYYTLDGTDPRLPGGGLASSAVLYAGPITLTNNARVVARVRNLNHMNLTGANKPPISSPWSGPAAATFVVATPPLVITEIMYHPPDAPPGSPYDEDDFEYIELKNIGSTPLNLTGIRFTNGIEFTFTGSSITSLAPGELVLIVKNQAAFLSRYPGVSNIAGEYSGSLNNSGERLYLEGALQEPILDFAYQDSWYPTTDGLGFSLVIVDENAPLNAWGLKSNWRPSGVVNGSPRQNDPVPPFFAPVIINEALTHTEPPSLDTIELHNPTATLADIGGWFLTDDLSEPKKFRIATGTTIPAGGFRLFDENDFNVTNGQHTPFSLDSRGEEIYLLFGNASTNLAGYIHGYKFGAAKNGVAFGRYSTSTGEEHFVAQSINTLSATNAGPKVGPVVLNEIMYHPPDLPGNFDNSDHEYLELLNITGQSVPLFDPAFPTNTWQLQGAVDFIFPTNVTLPSQSYLLVVSFEPANAGLLAGFRAKYGLSDNVPVLGPYNGKLDNSTDHVELYMPDSPDGGAVPYVLVDDVNYQDGPPWPLAGDGVGPSLQRIVSTAYGNDPINWIAALPTAGAVFGGGLAPTITAQPTNQTVVAYQNISFSVSADGLGPVAYQWRFNGAALVGATNSALVITNVQPNQDGLYSAVAFNSAGSVESTNARLTVLIPATITAQPRSQNVRPGTNVTLFVSAISSSQVTFQWRLNDTNILGATNSTFVITNIQVYLGGKYTVVVTDGIGSVVSDAATVTVLVNPLIVEHPQSQTVLVGDTVTFSVRVLGTTPFGYRWRRTNVTVVPFGQGTRSFTITNVQLSDATIYDVIITNLAHTSPGIMSNPALLTVLADSDGDRIPNNWEIAHGFDTNSVSDAALDADGDGLTNLEEYKAGTDPHDFSSALRLGQVVMDGNDVRIEFRGVQDKKYRLEAKDDLSGDVWRVVIDFKVGSVLEMELIDTGGATRPNRTYRITLLP